MWTTLNGLRLFNIRDKLTHSPTKMAAEPKSGKLFKVRP